MSSEDRQQDPFGGATQDRVEGTFDELKGRGKNAAGELTGDADLQGEGKVDQVIGKAKQGMGDAKDAVNDAVDKMTDR